MPKDPSEGFQTGGKLMTRKMMNLGLAGLSALLILAVLLPAAALAADAREIDVSVDVALEQF